MVNCMTMTGTRLTTTAEPQAGATIWEIDPAHSLIEFSVKHMMFTTVRGRFKKLRGTILCPDESDPTKASVEAEIDAATWPDGRCALTEAGSRAGTMILRVCTICAAHATLVTETQTVRCGTDSLGQAYVSSRREAEFHDGHGTCSRPGAVDCARA